MSDLTNNTDAVAAVKHSCMELSVLNGKLLELCKENHDVTETMQRRIKTLERVCGEQEEELADMWEFIQEKKRTA